MADYDESRRFLMRKIYLAANALLLAVSMNAHAAWDPSGVNVTQPVAKRFDH